MLQQRKGFCYAQKFEMKRTSFKIMISGKTALKLTFIFLLLNFLLFTVSLANAQDGSFLVDSEPLGDRQLRVGDSVPEYLWNTVFATVGKSEKEKQVSLKQFKDLPLILLDFWSTYCAPCIAMIPKIQDIKKKHENAFVAVPITNEQGDRIKAFMNRRDDLDFWSVVADTALEEAFPRESVPHEVWIKDGKVFAITDAYHINDSTVSGVIDGSIFSLPEKTFNNLFDDTLPLLIEGNGGGAEDVLYHAVVSGYIDGIVGARKGALDEQRYRISMMNASPVQLFKYLASIRDVKLGQSNRSRFQDVKLDSLSNLTRANLTHRAHLYCFELIIPQQMQDAAVDLAFSDLNKFFSSRYGFSASIETELTKCWVLKRISSHATASASELVELYETQKARKKSYNDISITTLVRLLNVQFKEITHPILDETGLDLKIDFEIVLGEEGWELTKNELRNLGLELILKEREMEMVVFKPITK